MKIPPGDIIWLESQAMPYFGVSALRIETDPSEKRWPDIWIVGNQITVTKEWLKQKYHERRKRLTHELVHYSWGFDHGKKGKYDFNTVPCRDSFSMAIYLDILRKGVK